MSILNKITEVLKHFHKNEESEINQKYMFLNFSLIFFSFFSLIFSVLHFFFSERITSYVLFVFSFLSFLLFFYFKKKIDSNKYSTLSIIIIFSFFVYILISGVGNSTGLVFGLTFPVILAFSFNIKKANLFSILFLLITIVVFYVPSSFWADYSTEFKFRYLSAFITIFIFIQYYLKIKQQDIYKKEKQILELEQKIRKQSVLLSNLSYKLRTPLNNISGFINLKSNEFEESDVEDVELSVSNLIAIINSISSDFNSNTLQKREKKIHFKFNSAIKKTASLFYTDKYRNLKINLQLSDTHNKIVFGERIILIQIILSSIDFFYNNNNNNGILKIKIISEDLKSSTGEKIKIKIISNSNYNFNKQLENNSTIITPEKNNKELTTLKELVNTFSGKLLIETEPSKSSFIFDLNFNTKLEKIVKTSTLALINEDIQTTNPKIKLENANILLVEDDVDNSKIMILNLKSHVNKIILAENGKEALEKFASTKIDLILMDVRMPLMDGFKTTEKIREAEAGIGRKIPIIAVTANASSEVKKKCLDSGMTTYMTKPTNYKLLLKKMKKLLD